MTATGSSPRPSFLPGVLVVKIRPDAIAGIDRGHLPEKLDAAFRAVARRGRLREVCASLAGERPRPELSRLAAAAVASVRDVGEEDLRGLLILRVGRRRNLDRVCRMLSDSPAVEYAHRAPARWPQGATAKTPRRRPSDPMANRQWGLRVIRWFEAPIPDARAVKVAIIDTGIDETHPDLEVAVYRHPETSAEDPLGHGTHVAGILGARTNNRAGIAGVCRPSLHVFKVFGDQPDDDGEFYVDELQYQRALNAVRRSGIRVLNLSLGGPGKTRTEALLIRKIIESGCVVVAAMGNEYDEGNPVEYPAAYPGVVAVGAIDEAGRHAGFSNSGKHIGLVAPGAHVLSTLPMKRSPYREPEERRYGAWSGTSMATPHVAGAAALILAGNPALTGKAVVERLRSRTSSLPAMGGKRWTRLYGDGLLDVRGALSTKAAGRGA